MWAVWAGWMYYTMRGEDTVQAAHARLGGAGGAAQCCRRWAPSAAGAIASAASLLGVRHSQRRRKARAAHSLGRAARNPGVDTPADDQLPAHVKQAHVAQVGAALGGAS